MFGVFAYSTIQSIYADLVRHRLDYWQRYRVAPGFEVVSTTKGFEAIDWPATAYSATCPAWRNAVLEDERKMSKVCGRVNLCIRCSQHTSQTLQLYRQENERKMETTTKKAFLSNLIKRISQGIGLLLVLSRTGFLQASGWENLDCAELLIWIR